MGLTQTFESKIPVCQHGIRERYEVLLGNQLIPQVLAFNHQGAKNLNEKVNERMGGIEGRDKGE